MSIRGEPEHEPTHTVSRRGGQRGGNAVAQGASPRDERDNVTPRGRDRAPAGGAGRYSDVATRAKCVTNAEPSLFLSLSRS